MFKHTQRETGRWLAAALALASRFRFDPTLLLRFLSARYCCFCLPFLFGALLLTAVDKTRDENKQTTTRASDSYSTTSAQTEPIKGSWHQTVANGRRRLDSLSLPLYCEFHIDSGSYACLGSSSKLGASAKLGGSQNRSRASRPLLLRIRLFALGSLSRSLSPLSLPIYMWIGRPPIVIKAPAGLLLYLKEEKGREEGRESLRTLNKRETLMRTQLKVIQDKQVVLCVMLAAIESSSNRPVRVCRWICDGKDWKLDSLFISDVFLWLKLFSEETGEGHLGCLNAQKTGD